MKKIFFIFLIVLSFKSFAQYPILSDSIKKAGIYRTFEEFKNNNPSIILDFINSAYKIESFARKYGNIGNRKSINVYGLNCDERISTNIGYIFGFCDGNKIYITSEVTQYPHHKSFYEIEYLNRYSYFDIVTTPSLGPVSNSIYTENLETKVIELATGKYKILTKSFIKKLISDNLELTKKFELQNHKSQHLKEYLIEYLKK